MNAESLIRHIILKAISVSVVATACSATEVVAPVSDPVPAARAPIRVVNSCSLPEPAVTNTIVIESDHPYARVDGRVLSFDVARPPAGGSARPAVVLFHGGGFRGGNKRGLHDELRTLASLGYVAISVEYRLSGDPNYRFPAPFSDGRCALRTIALRASTLGIDPARIAVGGTSAGGALALAIGINRDAALDAAMPAGTCQGGAAPVPSIKALVSWYGGGDLRDASLFGAGTAQALGEMLGGAPSVMRSEATLVSPIAHVDAFDPPTLHLHGELDGAVLITQAVRLDSALVSAGVSSRLIRIADMGHGFAPFSADPALRTAACTAIGFLGDRLTPKQ